MKVTIVSRIIVNLECIIVTQVSKYPVSRDVYDRIFDVFLKTISDLQSKKQIADFLNEFLTPTEQIMLAKRLAIAFLLTKKYDYKSISKILRVSTSTIGRVALSVKYGDSFRNVVIKILKDEKMEEFWLTVGEKVATLLATPKSKSGTWLYLKQELEKSKKGKVF